MFKFLLLMALAAIVWWAWQKGAPSRTRLPRREVPPERMAACARCGIHFPESEGIAGDGRCYCCEAHCSAGPAAPSP